jgi:anti-sigma B factor antagonist
MDVPILSVTTEGDGPVRTVRCSGKLVSDVSREFQAAVKPLLTPGGRVTIDLTGLTFMDSMGLGTVASLYVSSKVAGCTLELINLNRRIRDLFSVTHLLSLFEPCGQSNIPIT